MTLCRVYPVFVAGKRIEVRVHGAQIVDPATLEAIRELVEAVARAKRSGVSCEVIDQDVPQKVQP